MDFNKLEVVKTANPQMKPYDLEIVDPKTGYFMVTEKAMLEFEFHLNGMTQVNDEQVVYIGITDSDRSVFFKNSAKGETKFRKFKNINLMNQLMHIEHALFKGDKYTLVYVEDYKHYRMHLLTKFIEGQEPAPPLEETQPVAEEPILKEEIAKVPVVANDDDETEEEPINIY